MRWLSLGIGMALLWGGIANAQSIITMRDACDPDSFNAAVRPGTCVAGQHGTTLLGTSSENCRRTRLRERGGSIHC